VVTEADPLAVMVPAALVLLLQLVVVGSVELQMAEVAKAHQHHAVGGEIDLPSQDYLPELHLDASLPLQQPVKVQRHFQMQMVAQQLPPQPHVRIATSAQLLPVNFPVLGLPQANASLKLSLRELHPALPVASVLLSWHAGLLRSPCASPVLPRKAGQVVWSD